MASSDGLDNGKRDQYITFRATSELRNAIDKLATTEERKRGETARRLVLKALREASS